MRDELTYQRNGRTVALYAGLLDEAHDRGLASIDTELLQVPTPENEMVAIVKAVVEIANVDDEITVNHRRFTGIGDASPANVSRQIAPHILRQAETRAKARALRDAINAGAMALEDEAHDGEAPDEAPRRNDDEPLTNRTPGGASRSSANYLYGLMKGEKSKEERESLKEWVASLNQKQVSDLIEQHKEEEG